MAPFTRLPANIAQDAARRAAALLARDPRVRLVYVFGSATRPAAEVVRDVDLGIASEPAITGDELDRVRADLVLATGVPIDLVSLGEASVVLSREIADTGQCLYAAGPDDEVAFVTRARARYWDFKPFLDEQWRLSGERIEERRGRQG